MSGEIVAKFVVLDACKDEYPSRLVWLRALAELETMGFVGVFRKEVLGKEDGGCLQD